jgi:hypothetical protein
LVSSAACPRVPFRRAARAPYLAGSQRAPLADANLGIVMLALLVMGLMNYSMRDPCTC